jgi:glyoxylase-like metal-dependent hydrolase (beta-lactamase superfamily II)
MAVHELHYIKTGTVPGREDLLVQGGSVENVINCPVPIYYIHTKDGVFLIDSSFHMDDAKVLGAEEAVTRKMPEEDPLFALEKAGIKPKDVTKLILTHAHFDHVGYVDAFPKAKVYIHRKALAWVMALPSWSVGYGPFSVQKIYRVWEQLIAIDGDRVQIIPGIEVLYVGGHSAGSLAVLVDTKKGRVCLCIDNCFLYKNIEEKIPIGLAPNLYENIAFLEKLPSLGDISIPGHDPSLHERYPGGLIA